MRMPATSRKLKTTENSAWPPVIGLRGSPTLPTVIPVPNSIMITRVHLTTSAITAPGVLVDLIHHPFTHQHRRLSATAQSYRAQVTQSLSGDAEREQLHRAAPG